MSGERIYPEEIKTLEEYLIYLKEVFIYTWCKEKISKDARCLDVGCGEGYGTKLLSSSAKETVGIDIDKKIIEKASKKYADNNCAYKLYNGKNIPFADNYFDMIVSFHAIEHIKNDIGFIDEIYRVLKNAGLFIITTPNKAVRLPGNMPSWNVFHIREYTSAELKKLLTKKFKEVNILGIDAARETKKIEEERIRKNLKIASYDFLNLRRMLPAPFISFFIKMFRSVINSKQNYALDLLNKTHKNHLDVYKIELNPENALDILGICRK
mgnify:CR=1 FL=1